jgi:hypothetical protein
VVKTFTGANPLTMRMKPNDIIYETVRLFFLFARPGSKQIEASRGNSQFQWLEEKINVI